MEEENYITIPSWENNRWTEQSFKTIEDFRIFVKSLFKVPGKYEFNATSRVFNEQARIWRKSKIYCPAPFRSKDFNLYWDDQKNKCRRGAIYKDKGKTWYIPRDYYMWLNFLPIYDKEASKYDFAKVRDAQYHMALYELLAELHYTHAAVLKKRQIASSYFHAAKMINQIWFEEGVTNKMGASHKDYINEKGTWKFLDEYKSFLDNHTAWYRPMNPGKVMMWQQQIQISKGNRRSLSGNKGTIQGITFDKDPTNSVGGPCKLFFHEEAGVAPKMDTTYEFITPAMKSGHLTTGLFVAAGSVGDLDQCEPLKKFIMYPEVNSIYAVETDLLDEKGTLGTSGLFIPEQWSMPPYIDEFGNSLVEKAIEAIDLERGTWKRELSPEIYQLRISQHPKNIAEAFAFRKASIFPAHLVSAQQRRITEKEYGYEFLDIYRDGKGDVAIRDSNKLPIREFPISPKTESKEGVLVVWERPISKPDFGMYYASIDPVSEGKTTTSDSLVSIYVYKTPVQIIKQTLDGPVTSIERDKIVAAWCGRFDDINTTHERLELIVEWYNAWTVVENNVSLFIQHMIHRKKQRYLVPKSQMLFLKDIGSNSNVFQEYGWKNTGNLFKGHLLSYAIEFLKEELDVVTKPDGTIVKTVYGVERIPDPMLLVEMLAYQDGVNVDRLVSFTALIAFAKVQEANRRIRTRVEESRESLQKTKDLYKLNKQMFNHLGSHSKQVDPLYQLKRSPFKNLK